MDSRSGVGQWKWDGLQVLGVCLLVGLFYLPLFSFDGRIQSGGDGANLFWPLRALVSDAMWGQGEMALWNPYAFMGSPLHATMQHSVFYPPNWVIYGIFPAHVGLNVENLFHLMLLGVGVWFWLAKAVRLGGFAAFFGGAIFPCVAYFWGHQEHVNQLGAAAWMPWIVAVAFLFLRRGLSPPFFLAAYGLLSAVQFLSGHPQSAVYTQLFVIFLFLGHGGIELWRCRDSDAVKGLGVKLGGFVLGGILMGFLIAVQLLPTLELRKFADRSAFYPAWSHMYSMPPDVTRVMLSPHYFGNFVDGYWTESESGEVVRDLRAYNEYGLFLGLPVLLLALLSLGLLKSRRIVGFLMMAAAVTMLLVYGGNTDLQRITSGNFSEFTEFGVEPSRSLYDAYLAVFPPARGLRVPARIYLLTAFCLVTLAAVTVSAIQGKISDRRWRFALNVAIIGGCWLSLYLPSQREKFRYPVEAGVLIPSAMTVAQTGGDATLDNRLFRLTTRDEGIYQRERHFEDTFEGNRNPILDRFLRLTPHMNYFYQVPLVAGYEEGLLPTVRLKDFLFEFNNNIRRFQPDAELLALMGVAGVWSDLPMDTEVFAPQLLPGHQMIQYYENPRFVGAAFWKETFQGVDWEALDSPYFRGERDRPRLVDAERNQQLVNYGDVSRHIDFHEGCRLRTEIVTVNEIRIFGSVCGPLEGDAILTMGWFPGWRHGQSGNEAEFLNAIHLVLPLEEATIVDGVVEWRVRYRPTGYRWGLLLSGLGLCMVGLLTAKGIVDARRRKETEFEDES